LVKRISNLFNTARCNKTSCTRSIQKDKDNCPADTPTHL